MKTVNLAPHEFHANLLFDSHGLDPFFALDSVIKRNDGSATCRFQDDGEKWIARLSYRPSNIVHPGSRTPQGTPFEIETIREYQIKVFRDPHQDPIGKQDFSAHIAPRWHGMEGEKDDGSTVEISVPAAFSEGVNATLKGSNIAFDRYHTLLKKAMALFSIDQRYFANPHPLSNIQDAELYARLDRDLSGPVHARDGPIAQMGHLLEGDRDGYRKLVQNERDEHDRNLPGYYHTVTLGPMRIREAFPTHGMAKEIKHYYAREALSLEKDHPLAHPKLGSSLQASQMSESVRWDDLDQLETELAETVLSVLAESGLDVAPEHSDGPYVTSDAYFDATVDESGPDPLSLDLTKIKQEQEHIVVRHLADGFSPAQSDAIETLVTDGGQTSPSDIADEHGYHVDSVRRALRDMEELVERGYAEVQLRSDYVADLLHESVKEAKDAVGRALDTAAKAERTIENGAQQGKSAFVAWAARHGIDVKDRREAQLTLRFDGKSDREVRRAIQDGYQLWTDAGLPAARFRSARLDLGDRGFAEAWRYLRTD